VYFSRQPHICPGRCKIGCAPLPGWRLYEATKPGFSFFVFILCCIFVLRLNVCIYCVSFSFFSTMPRNWLGRTSPLRPVLCLVGRKTLTQSFRQGVSCISCMHVLAVDRSCIFSCGGNAEHCRSCRLTANLSCPWSHSSIMLLSASCWLTKCKVLMLPCPRVPAI